MNYRHLYHAGGPADVLKHLVLAEILAVLIQKPTPLFVLDTHAGIGLYDLTLPEAAKTGEWRDGIGRLFRQPSAPATPYLDIIRALNPNGALALYPGSPEIAARLLRAGDRLAACELHPEDATHLRAWAQGRPAIAVHRRDGYEAMRALLPPAGRRGLVVVDPPYESPDEFERLARAIVAGHRRWPNGRWLIWYPIKDRTPVWRLEEALLGAGLPNLLSVELLVRPADGIDLAGSGLILVEPPFGLDARLAALLPELTAALAPKRGSHALRWLART